MALTITIRFLAGRAHLHPWQTHHSEGRVEWPPSPWRLLRAIVAVAGRGLTTLPPPDFVADSPKKLKNTKANSSPEWPASDYSALPDNWTDDAADDEIPISRLAALLLSLSDLPEIWLPRTQLAHTRHFFPIHEGGVVKPAGTAVLDTFAVIRRDQPIVFSWRAVNLDERQAADLSRILQRMTYFGRSESWCDAEAHSHYPEDLAEVKAHRTHWVCVCIDGGSPDSGLDERERVLVRTLAPLSDQPLIGEVGRLLPRTTKAKKTEEGLEKILQSEERCIVLLRCLLRESGQDMKDGLDRPIGTRWVHYAVPRVLFESPPPKPKRVKRSSEHVHIVHYALNTASVHRPILPPITDTLLIADRFRSASIAVHESIHRAQNKPHPRNLCGRDENGDILRGHRHAFFWPTDDDNDGFIDHVTVWCPAGFQSDEADALRNLCRFRQRGGRPDLLITPVFVGAESEFDPWQAAQSQTFVSATPYFCPIHLSHGKSRRSPPRPLTPRIIQSLIEQNIVASEQEIDSIREIIFDYSAQQLRSAIKSIHRNEAHEPLPPRQYFPVIDPPITFPTLAQPDGHLGARYPNAALKNPDDGYPFGLQVGLFVSGGTRFIRALNFTRRRRNFTTLGSGRMLLIRFRDQRSSRPFAIGAQCHFGLGLFAPLRKYAD